MSEIFYPLIPADIVWQADIPYSRGYQDVYFSRENGLEESRHVFIDGNALITRWQSMAQQNQTRFVIAETGFGTGLNFLLTWQLWHQYAPAGAQLHYISCEKHPLRRADLQKALRNWPQFAEMTQSLLAQWPPLLPGTYSLDFSASGLQLVLLFGEAQTAFASLADSANLSDHSVLKPPQVDAWFLDGFAPSKNAAMWSDALFRSMAQLSGKGTSVATFSVARQVRDGLQRAGFLTEKAPGFGNKRQMLKAAYKPDSSHRSAQKSKTNWHYPYLSSKPSRKTAMIIGAGLAGSCMAQQLALRGWRVTVFDKAAEPAQGASGNHNAVLFPAFSAYDSPMSALMIQAWHYATNFYARYKNPSTPGEFHGLVQFLDQDKRLEALKGFLADHPELVSYKEAAALSRLSGVKLDESGFYYPEGGWIDMPAFCASLLEHPLIRWEGGQAVRALEFAEGNWQIASHLSPVLIVCAGHESPGFEQTRTLPLKGIRGQMSWVPPSAQSQDLRIPLCGKGHILPATRHLHALGASYDLAHDVAFCHAEDDSANLEKIREMPAALGLEFSALQSWSGVRAVTRDYLPLLGPVSQEAEFNHAYAALRKDANASIPFQDARYPGLYICAGFGSKGAVTIPYCSRWLAGIINAEPSIFSQRLQQALSPARFLYRNLYRGRSRL